MKVFITGIAGFLGSHLADRLVEAGHAVVGIDNLIGGYKENIPSAADFFHVDCLDREGLLPLMVGVDIVVHTACTAYEGLSVFSPSLVSNNTYQSTVSVLSAAVSSGVGKFIHCSSMARYGTQDTVPFHEQMVCKPQDPYGIAKYASELAVANICETHGMDYSILVPHNIIGPRQKYDDPYRNVASIMTNRLLQGKAPIIYGTGEQQRCFSFIDDCIYCIQESLVRPEALGEVINIGPDTNSVTINELAVTLQQIIGTDFEPIYLPGRPQEVFHATCSADKARKILDYKEDVTLRQGLTEIVKYVQARGPREFNYHLPIEIVSTKTPKSWTERLI